MSQSKRSTYRYDEHIEGRAAYIKAHDKTRRTALRVRLKLKAELAAAEKLNPPSKLQPKLRERRNARGHVAMVPVKAKKHRGIAKATPIEQVIENLEREIRGQTPPGKASIIADEHEAKENEQ